MKSYRKSEENSHKSNSEEDSSNSQNSDNSQASENQQSKSQESSSENYSPIRQRMAKTPKTQNPENQYIKRLSQIFEQSFDNSSTSCISWNTETPKTKEICQNCLSAFCKSCFDENKGKDFKCPKCNSTFQKFNFTQLQKRIPLLLQPLAKDPSKTYCTIHSEEPIDLYCKECKELSCTKCFVKSHNGHTNLEIPSFLTTIQPKVKNYEHSLKEKRSQLQASKVQIKQFEKGVKGDFERVEKLLGLVKGVVEGVDLDYGLLTKGVETVKRVNTNHENKVRSLLSNHLEIQEKPETATK